MTRTSRPFWRRWELPFLLLVGVAELLILSRFAPPSPDKLAAQFSQFATVALGIIIEALPFVLIGVLASSAIAVFLDARKVERLCPRSPLFAALTGAMLGLAFPVCECGSVPAARRLMWRGAPLQLGIAFVLAAPVVNPVVIASTAVAFSRQPSMIALRVGLTVFVAVVVALLVGSHPRPHELLTKAEDDHHAHDCATHTQGTARARALLLHASHEFLEMSRYVVIGATLAAALQTFVPRSALMGFAQDPLRSALALMAIAALLSICSTADAFVSLAFVNSFLPGAVLAFLVFGPMVDVKGVLMYSSTFRRSAVVAMVGLTFLTVLFAAVVVNVLS